MDVIPPYLPWLGQENNNLIFIGLDNLLQSSLGQEDSSTGNKHHPFFRVKGWIPMSVAIKYSDFI